MLLKFHKFLFFLFLMQLIAACTLYRSDGRKDFESEDFSSLTLLSCELITANEAKQLPEFVETYSGLHNRASENLVTELLLEKNEQFQLCIYEQSATGEDSI